jgi:hypothetical protein
VIAARAPTLGLCGAGPDGVLPDLTARAGPSAPLMIAPDTVLWLESSLDLTRRHSTAMPT